MEVCSTMASRFLGRRPALAPSYVYLNRLQRLLLGKPKSTGDDRQERLNILTGLAVFSADSVSSVAYATEEILLVLAAAGSGAGVFSLPVGLAIVTLILIVSVSYNQTIRAYPGGGGSYVVSKENLGVSAGLAAGAALMVDYFLTVAVSTASGIAAITSAVPALQGREVVLGLVAIWFIAWVNLRGVRESGAFFSVLTYGFVIAMGLLLVVGAYKAIFIPGFWHPAAPVRVGFGLGGGEWADLTQGVTLFMLLRAFASGCTALSGIEAVSNGVQAFKPPEAENAVKTLRLSRTLLYTVFTGITLLAYGLQLFPQDGETLLSQIAREVFHGGPLYYVVQVMTAAILLLAANTAYAGFPRLASMLAADGYLPRKLANRGDTLVYNDGVLVLACLASALIILFQGDVHLLIPLYAVGVFLAFTVSQCGMVVHWTRVAQLPGESLRRHAGAVVTNALGAVFSGVALLVIAVSKFTHGAWIVWLIIPLIMLYFTRVHDYYERFKDRVESLEDVHMRIDQADKVKVVMTIGGLSPVIDHAMQVARRFSDDVTAVYVATDPAQGAKVARKWDRERHGGTPLVVLDSPYRTIVPPLRRYLTELQQANPGCVINLLVPVVVTNDPFDSYLHNGTANQMLRELRFSEGILITVIPFYVNMDPMAQSALAAYPPVSEI